MLKQVLACCLLVLPACQAYASSDKDEFIMAPKLSKVPEPERSVPVPEPPMPVHVEPMFGHAPMSAPALEPPLMRHAPERPPTAYTPVNPEHWYQQGGPSQPPPPSPSPVARSSGCSLAEQASELCAQELPAVATKWHTRSQINSAELPPR